ncbi:MAG: hypothetical protein EBT68_05065 [Verrucomicrobia bacterium]|nr:hypothetical protein [Verrucomicrobiota bacterium]
MGYEAATHVVVGFTCNSGGILATATDQLTAYRYARLYRQHGWTGVKVMPESEHTHKQVNQQMYEFIDT